MATYLEINDIVNDAAWPAFRQKLESAIVIAAYDISQEVTPTAERKEWAARAAGNPEYEVARFAPMIVAANKGLAVATMLAASDSAISTEVDKLVDVFSSFDSTAGV